MKSRFCAWAAALQTWKYKTWWSASALLASKKKHGIKEERSKTEENQSCYRGSKKTDVQKICKKKKSQNLYIRGKGFERINEEAVF